MVWMALGAGDTLPGDDEEGNGERMEAESSTFMSADHMKMQPVHLAGEDRSNPYALQRHASPREDRRASL